MMQATTTIFILMSISSIHLARAKRSSAESTMREYLLSLPDNELHHVCLTGNRAHKFMESFVMPEGHELSNFSMKSSLNPDTKCEVKDYKVANTLFLVSDDITETCSARWKVHSASCDVLLHAHDGPECDLMYKFRLITDQCDAPFVVLHSDSDLMECYNNKVNMARFRHMMPLHEECTNVTHSVLVQMDQSDNVFNKNDEVIPAIRSALQLTSGMVRERYSHLPISALQRTNDSENFRQVLKGAKRKINDIGVEMLRAMQEAPLESDNAFSPGGFLSFLSQSQSAESKEDTGPGGIFQGSLVKEDTGPGGIFQGSLVKDIAKHELHEHSQSSHARSSNVGAHENAAIVVESDEVSLEGPQTRHRGWAKAAAKALQDESGRIYVFPGGEAGGAAAGAAGAAAGAGARAAEAAGADPSADRSLIEADAQKKVEAVQNCGSAAPAPYVVIDNGSGTVKIGCQMPPVSIDSIVGLPKYPYVIPTGATGIAGPGHTAHRPMNLVMNSIWVLDELPNADTNPAVGHAKEFSKFRGTTHIEYPVQRGVIYRLNLMRVVWEYALSQVDVKAGNVYTSGATPIAGVKVLLTEAPLNPKKNREFMVQAFLQTYGADSVFVMETAVAALFGAELTTGLVIDIGDGVTHIAPIVEGYALPHAVKRLDLAGHDLTALMARQLTEEDENAGRWFHTSAEFEIAKYIKEQLCYVAYEAAQTDDDFAKAMQAYIPSGTNSNAQWYTMPDGQPIKIGTQQFRVPEALFKPHIAGVESAGIPTLVVDAVEMCDVDVRKKLYGTMIFSGGSTLFKNMLSRFEKEIWNDPRVFLQRADVKFIDQTATGKGPLNLAFKGANTLCSTPNVMDNLWYKKSEYTPSQPEQIWDGAKFPSQQYNGLRSPEDSIWRQWPTTPPPR